MRKKNLKKPFFSIITVVKNDQSNIQKTITLMKKLKLIQFHIMAKQNY